MKMPFDYMSYVYDYLRWVKNVNFGSDVNKIREYRSIDTKQTS